MLLICIFNITTLPTFNITGRESYGDGSFWYKNISRVNPQHINLMIYTAFLIKSLLHNNIANK